MSFNNLRLNQYHKNFAKTGIVQSEVNDGIKRSRRGDCIVQ